MKTSQFICVSTGLKTKDIKCTTVEVGLLYHSLCTHQWEKEECMVTMTESHWPLPALSPKASKTTGVINCLDLFHLDNESHLHEIRADIILLLLSFLCFK